MGGQQFKNAVINPLLSLYKTIQLKRIGTAAFGIVCLIHGHPIGTSQLMTAIPDHKFAFDNAVYRSR